jgi:hypothetical protein
LAIPGQAVLMLNSPVAAADEATSLIGGYGGAMLAQVPRLGMYLVETQPGQEDVLLQKAQGDSRILAAFANLVIESQGSPDAGVFSCGDGGSGTTSSPANQPMPAVSIIEVDCGEHTDHACHVASVLNGNAAVVTSCFKTGEMELADGGNLVTDGGLATFGAQTSMWSALWGLVGAADTPNGQATFINMSLGPGGPMEDCVSSHLQYRAETESLFLSYENAKRGFWKAIVDTLLLAFRVHCYAQQQVVAAVSAGNYGVPLDESLRWLYQAFGRSSSSGSAEQQVLESNIAIVTQATPELPAPGFPARYDYVGTWQHVDADIARVVVGAGNSWGAYGTSLAAPYALAQVHARWKAAEGSLTPSEVLVAIKSAAASSANHAVPGDTGDNPLLPTPATNEIMPSSTDMSNCPVHSEWSADLGACVFSYYDEQGQQASGVGTFPWVQFARWPDVQTSLGLTGTWISLDPATCQFTDTMTVSTADQVTTGLLATNCGIPITCPTYSGRVSTMCTSGSIIATSISGSATVSVTSDFKAELIGRWPQLPCCDLGNDYPNIVVH